jgi:hypothetical protein
MMSKIHRGPTLDEFLKEEGLKPELSNIVLDDNKKTEPKKVYTKLNLKFSNEVDSKKQTE